MEFEVSEGAFDDIASFLSPPIFVVLLVGEIAISVRKDTALVAEQRGICRRERCRHILPVHHQ